MKNRVARNAALNWMAAGLLVACSGDRWNGGKYEGDITIDGVKPTNSKPERFSLVAGKTKRFVRMDAANKHLASCDIPIDDKYSAGITDDSRYVFDEKSALCSGVTVYAGDLTLEGDKGTLSLVGVAPDGRSYTMKLAGVRK